MKIIRLTSNFAVTGQMFPEDFAEAARLGFRSIISNRPDGEDPSQPTAREEAVLAWRLGLLFRHVPAAKHDLFTDPVLEATVDALAALPTPVLAHCASGQRSAIIWAAASARSQPVDCVLAALKAGGYELEELRDLLEAQADRKRWLGTPQALDCGDNVSRIDRSVA